MLEWIRNLLVGPKLTSEERQEAIRCTESMSGRKVFHLDGPATTQLIKEYGFPVKECHGDRYLN